MACTQEFIDFVCRQLTPVGEISWRKMMGDYVIYANGKCVITACLRKFAAFFSTEFFCPQISTDYHRLF